MGVREYLIALVVKRQLLWKRLSPAGYQLLEPGADGILRSPFFPGLWLDPEALWHLDTGGLLNVLQKGLATAEHAAFATRRPEPLR